MPLEKQISLPVQPEMERELAMPEFRKMHDNIINLEVESNIGRIKKLEDLNNRLSKGLADIKKELDQLAGTYAGNDGFQELVRMHSDLKQDLQRDEKMQLDTSLRVKMKEAQQTIIDVGIVSSSPEGVTDSNVKEQIEMLTRLGILIDRVTLRPGADKTVILFTWAHTTLGMTKQMKDENGITDSQEKVATYISRLQKAGISSTVFTEGVRHNLGLKKMQKKLKWMIEEGFQFVGLGKDINIRGVENIPYLMKTLTNMEKNSIKMRVNVNNIVMAANIGKAMQSGETAIATMGALHEFTISGYEIELPYSQTIALEANANVIVVDTSKAF